MRLARLAPAGAVFAAALALYALTLAPGLCWGDGARLQLDAALGGSTYFFFPELAGLPFDGLPFERLGVAAWDHPLYVMLGRLVSALPLGAPAVRVTAISALAAALAVALAWRVMLRLTGDGAAAALGALSLALAHTFWFHAVTAEVYTLHALFMLALIDLALSAHERPRRALLLFALLTGLGMANHLMLALTALPCLVYALFAASAGPRNAGVSRRTLWLAVLLFVLAFAPWWVQALRMARLVGVETLLAAALATPWLPRRLSPDAGQVARNLLAYLAWLCYQFGPLGVGIAAWGAVGLLRAQKRAGVLLLALWSMHVLFSANYDVADRFAFHLPSYVVFALWFACGLAALRRRVGRTLFATLALALLATPPLCYAAAPHVLRAAGYDDSALGAAPVGTDARDTAGYFLQPWKNGERSAERWGRTTLDSLPTNAVVIAAWPADTEAYLVLRYVQLVERRRPDIRLDLALDSVGRPIAERIRERVAGLAGCHDVFLASPNRTYDLERLGRSYEIVADSGVLRLSPRGAIIGQPNCSAAEPAVDLEQLLEAMRQ